MGWRSFRPNRLVCPFCNYDGSTPPHQKCDFDVTPFLWLEDTTVHWNVVALNDKAIQMEDGCVHREDYWNPRIQCASCGGEFPPPTGKIPEFIDLNQIDWSDGQGV